MCGKIIGTCLRNSRSQSHARLMCPRFSALTGCCSGERVYAVDDSNAPYSVRKEVGTD